MTGYLLQLAAVVAVLAALVRLVVWGWRALVDEDLALDPLDDDQLAESIRLQRERESHRG
jgi:predicted metal-dependent hydrolase